MSDVSVSQTASAVPSAGAAIAPNAGPVPRFDVIITPASSLDTGGVRWFFAGLMVITAVMVAILSVGHLWVAAIFVVADAAFLAIAFVACRRDLRRAERVVIDDHRVVIERVDGEGRPVETRVVPLFGLWVERHIIDGEVHGVSLVHREARLAVARDLSPAERATFLVAFLDALTEAGWRRRVETVDTWATAP
jgi:uncharacterized membrane protein